MDRQRRSNLALGVIFILVGAWFLGRLLFPELLTWFPFRMEWPFYVIGAGALIFLIGLLVGSPEMSVPAAVVAGIGGLLYWQNATDNWQSWAYAWALIPGFAGVGTLIAALLGDNPRQNLRHGLNLVVISLIMFAIFASIFGGLRTFGPYWPVLLILLGVWFLVRALLHR